MTRAEVSRWAGGQVAARLDTGLLQDETRGERQMDILSRSPLLPC